VSPPLSWLLLWLLGGLLGTAAYLGWMNWVQIRQYRQRGLPLWFMLTGLWHIVRPGRETWPAWVMCTLAGPLGWGLLHLTRPKENR
jgi:hypothetical protein